jgi:hypothetical protein
MIDFQLYGGACSMWNIHGGHIKEQGCMVCLYTHVLVIIVWGFGGNVYNFGVVGGEVY